MDKDTGVGGGGGGGGVGGEHPRLLYISSLRYTHGYPRLQTHLIIMNNMAVTC